MSRAVALVGLRHVRRRGLLLPDRVDRVGGMAFRRATGDLWFGCSFKGNIVSDKRPLFRVELINYQTLHAQCGCGVGKTLEAAQRDALERARRIDHNAKLSANGHQVWFAGGVNS